MKVFFDCEMTSLDENSQLISIGLVDEDGRTFYAEFNDFNDLSCSQWVKENVLDNRYLVYNIRDNEKAKQGIKSHEGENYISNFYYGDSNCIRVMLENWLKKYDAVELVSDVCHYDMFLFCNLMGDAFMLPDNVTPACYDINQDIMRYYNISMQEAFDMSREDILYQNYRKIEGNKHNSLYDAKVIKEIYYIIHPNEVN